MTAISTKQYKPPGHFYSSIPDLNEIREKESLLFSRKRNDILGIDLRENAQIKLLTEEFIKYYHEQPWHDNKVPHLRYHFANHTYSYSDAIFLYCMLRHLSPARIIEIGSGNSSCVTLDTNDIFFDGQIKCTFIEPNPQFILNGLLRPEDAKNISLFPNKLQDIDINLFIDLQKNDVLFIDSTHVSKIGSDVNRIFFEILPSLMPGVYVHFHDIFYPFEYPSTWIYEGRQFNESYMMRAFLQYNEDFEIIIWNDFLEEFHRPFFEENMPLCLNNTGASIWLHKLK